MEKNIVLAISLLTGVVLLFLGWWWPIYRQQHVYCLMVTGKDDERIDLAKNAVKNFLSQSYRMKHLVIVNHHHRPVLGPENRHHKHIREVMVHRGPDMTLGDMRNISLRYVPDGAITCVWDDDDWRDTHYLRFLYQELMRNPETRAVAIRHRLEFNKNTGAVWKSTLEDGFYWYFMYKDPRFLYAQLNTGEDGIIRRNLLRINETQPNFYRVVDNPARMYLRFVHDNNTSRYVLKDQAGARNFVKTSKYQETQASAADQVYALEIYKKYG